jgi:outer membrane protein assembly factor BamA
MAIILFSFLLIQSIKLYFSFCFLKYTNIIDRRDNTTLPTKGGHLKTSVEAAGLGGDVKFLKFNSDYQYSRTFLSYFVNYFSRK